MGSTERSWRLRRGLERAPARGAEGAVRRHSGLTSPSGSELPGGAGGRTEQTLPPSGPGAQWQCDPGAAPPGSGFQDWAEWQERGWSSVPAGWGAPNKGNVQCEAGRLAQGVAIAPGTPSSWLGKEGAGFHSVEFRTYREASCRKAPGSPCTLARLHVVATGPSLPALEPLDSKMETLPLYAQTLQTALPKNRDVVLITSHQSQKFIMDPTQRPRAPSISHPSTVHNGL